VARDFPGNLFLFARDGRTELIRYEIVEAGHTQNG
jgi:hypothetical protein